MIAEQRAEFIDGQGPSADECSAVVHLAGSEDNFCGAWLGQAYDLLDASERDRARGFRFDHDRSDYVAAHALLRLALSRRAGIHPKEWRFTTGRLGKPMVAWPLLAPALSVSLSHTRGIVACAIGSGVAVGVDVERIRAVDDTLSLAREFFSRSEAASLESMSDRSRRARFFELWALKESYSKALGLGLSLPLDATAFESLDGRLATCVSYSRIANPNGWQFGIRVAEESHVLAFAVGPRECGRPGGVLVAAGVMQSTTMGPNPRNESSATDLESPTNCVERDLNQCDRALTQFK